MTHPTLFPLVGAHFRPPAKQILAALPPGVPLTLIPEPENPYDPAAIAVYLDPEDLQDHCSEALEAELEGTGHTLEDLAEPIHLGYVAKSGGKPAAKLGLPGNAELEAAAQAEGLEVPDLALELAFAPAGDPLVRILWGASHPKEALP